MSNEIEQFRKERNEAFLSLNEDKIRSFFRRWNGQEMSSNPVVFWASVHKAITGNMELNIEFRRKSKNWLTAQGMQSMDDGDLS